MSNHVGSEAQGCFSYRPWFAHWYLEIHLILNNAVDRSIREKNWYPRRQFQRHCRLNKIKNHFPIHAVSWPVLMQDTREHAGVRSDLLGWSHVSTGLATMLFGVSGNCDDREVASLPEELPMEPDSEKDTCDENRCLISLVS